MGEKNPLLSVLVTIYNRGHLIIETLDSIINSDFQDFELIIVDDASTDNSVALCREFEETDGRIRIYQNAVNLGDYGNRNKAASYAKGLFIKYVDSDDVISVNCLGVMLKGMLDNPEAALGLMSFEDEDKMKTGVAYSPREAFERHFFKKSIFINGPSTSIINREAFLQAGCFKTQRMVSDVDLWFHLASKYPIVLLPGGLVSTRRHAAQELTDMNKFILDYEKIKWAYLLAPEPLLTSSQVKRIYQERKRKYLSFIFSGLRHLNFVQAWNYTRCLAFLTNLNIEE